MRTLKDIDYAGNGDARQFLDAYLPEENGFDTLVYFHGGGLKRGDRDKCLKLLPLADENIALVSCEYRMLPEAHFPDFLLDAAKAVRFVRDHVKEWGGNGRLFVSGASAGAWITMMLCLDKKYLQDEGVLQEEITGYISESAQQFAHFSVLEDRGFDPRIERIDETAPISFLKEGLVIRPLILLYYSDDMYCRPEENLLMYRSMKRFVPEDSVLSLQMIPGGHCKPDDPEERLAAYTGFIKAACGEQDRPAGGGRESSPEQQRVKLDKEKLEDVIGGVEARCRVSAGRKGENTAEGKIGPTGTKSWFGAC